MLCQQIGAQVAEPRSTDQLQFLSRVLRESGDASMWVGLKPVAPKGWSPGDDGWMWRGTGDNLTDTQANWAAQQPGVEGHCVSLWPDGTWNVRACGGDSRSKLVCTCEAHVDSVAA